MSNFTNLIDELRRRRVFRVAAFYGGIAFVIVQIIDGTFEVMGIPAWVSRLLITLMALGFPVSMILAWVFDITEDGIVRTKGNSTPSTTKIKPGTSNRALVAVTIAAIAFGIWGRWGNSEAQTDFIKVAVLPFDNYSDNAEEWFSDGITDYITTQLAKVGEITVIGRTSVMQYKGTNKRLNVIGAELGVDALLEGSVQRIGGRVRIVAQLIDAATEGHLWTDSYDSEVTDDEIFSLQSDVAARIVEALVGSLGKADQVKLDVEPTQNIEAYNFYLRGLFYWNKRTGDDIVQAIEHFEAAAALDPNYADAYAGLAMSYAVLHEYAQVPPVDSYPKARQAAETALRLDPGNSMAYAALGYVFDKYEYDWEKSETAYLTALQLDPNFATGHQWYAELLTILGREAEFNHHAELSAKLDPLSMIVLRTYNFLLQSWGRYEEALVPILQSSRLYGTEGERNIVSTYFNLKRFDDSFAAWEKFAQLFVPPDRLAMVLSNGREAYLEGGPSAWGKWNADGRRRSGDARSWAVQLSNFKRVGLDSKWVEDQILEHGDWYFGELNRMIDTRDVGAWYSMVSLSDLFGKDPRFIAARKRMNLD